MSLNITPLVVKAVVDPRLEISSQKDYICTKGALVNSWQQFPATNVNNSSFQISCNPPSRDIAISRLVFKKVSFVWSITGTNTSGGTLLNVGYYGPRAMPLTSVTQSEQMTINNDTITQAPIQQYLRALLRYRNDFSDRFGALSLAPSMLDQFQTYAEGSASVRNPLASYGDNSFENTRGGYAGFTINPQVPGNTVASGTLTTYEPIMMSPFCFGDRANFYSSFAGIQNMSYTCTLGNLQRILSLTQGQGAPPGQVVLGTPSVDVVNASLLFNYLTPDPVMTIPRNMETSYYSLTSYPTRSLVPVAPGANIQMTMNSIQVTSIPKRIYVFSKIDDSQETAFTSDTFLSLNPTLNPISLTWNNNQFLSQASTADLYNVSVKNGCNMSFSQFIDKTGSVLAIDSGLDFGLMSSQSSGVIGNYQLSISANFVNTSSVSVLPTLYCVVVSEGSFNISNGNCSHMLGILSPSDVLNAEILPAGSYSRSTEIYGGKFERLRDFFSKAHNFIKENKLVSRGLQLLPGPTAQMLSRGADTLGYGSSGGGVDDYGGSLYATTKKLKKKMNLSDLA
jgi:hypothetical protein